MSQDRVLPWQAELLAFQLCTVDQNTGKRNDLEVGLSSLSGFLHPLIHANIESSQKRKVNQSLLKDSHNHPH